MAGTGSATLDAIRAYLIAQGVGQADTKQDWAIFVGAFQDGAPVVDKAICLYETPGPEPDPAWALIYPSMQICGRGAPDDFSVLRQKMQDIFTALHGADGLLGSPFVYYYAKHSAPIYMGRDEKRRMTMGWNFRSMRNTPA